MHLRSAGEQSVSISAIDLTISFEDGETIWTESSHKFDAAELLSMASERVLRKRLAGSIESGRSRSASGRSSARSVRVSRRVGCVIHQEFLVDRFAATETFFDPVPELNVLLSQSPAEIDFAAMVQGGKVEESNIEILDEAAVLLDSFEN